MSEIKRNKVTGSQLAQLNELTIVVADTGEVQAIQQYQPRDATTNPSLILKAALLPEYAHLVDDAIKYAQGFSNLSFEEKRELAMDKLSVNFGAEITKIVGGFVSTEVDARLSFDIEGTIKRAHRIIDMYKQLGIDKSRILIKIASTYEGIRAAEQLQKEGIQCNLTLLFNLVQAAACAEAGITLISPFVGRILDWHKAKHGKEFPGASDPGVISVSAIYGYFKRHGFKTIVMGASFRSKEEVLSLAGCDRLTIAPGLLKQLQESDEPIQAALSPERANELYPSPERVAVDENSFRWAMNEDPMATEKLAEGIRNFAADIVKLEKVVGDKLASC